MFNIFKKKRQPNWQQLIDQATEAMNNSAFDKAIHLAKQADQEISIQATQEKEALAWTNYIIGRAAIYAENWAVGEEALLKSKRLCEEGSTEGYQQILLQADFALGELYHLNKRYQEAWKILTKLEVEIASEEKGLMHLKSYIFLAEASQKIRKYEDAIGWFEKYLELLPQLYKKEETNYEGVEFHKDKLKAALDAKKAGFPEPFITVKSANGGGSMFDAQYAAWMVSELPDPSQESLDKAFEQANKLQLFKFKVERNEELDANVRVEELVFEEENKEELDKLASKMQMVVKDEYGHMMCVPEIRLKLHNDSGEMVTLDFLTPATIRWEDGWKDDGELQDGPFFEKWLRERGAEFPQPAS